MVRNNGFYILIYIVIFWEHNDLRTDGINHVLIHKSES